MKNSLSIFILFLLANTASAQIDLQCNGRDAHSVYFNSNGNIYRIDSVDTHPTDPFFVAVDSIDGGISINKNLDNNSGAISMYSCSDIDGYYHYWDSTHWVNTHHFTGTTSNGPINPGGSDRYIFNLDGGGNAVYRYDGTGDGTLLVSGLPTFFSAVWDIAVDNLGNFYIFYFTYNQIVAYNPDGIPIDTFTTSGYYDGVGGGLAIIGSRIYSLGYSPVCLVEGIISGHNINFTNVKSLPTITKVCNDMASCPQAGNPLAVFKVPEAPHFSIYPNPAKDIADARLNNTTTLEVTDCMGRKILSAETRGLMEYQLPVSKWGHGVYFVTATSPDGLVARSTLLVQ